MEGAAKKMQWLKDPDMLKKIITVTCLVLTTAAEVITVMSSDERNPPKRRKI